MSKLSLIIFLGGLACVGCEIWGAYEFLMAKYGHWNYQVVGGVVLTGLSAVLPFAAEYAWQQGLRMLCWAARLAMPLTVVFVFVAAIDRTSSSVDAEEATRKQQEILIEKAVEEEREIRERLDIDKDIVRKNCGILVPRCTKARDALAATEARLEKVRTTLKEKGVVIQNSWAVRVEKILPFLTREQVLLYEPMLLPLGLAIVGTVLIAIGAHETTSRRMRKAGNAAIKTQQIVAPSVPKAVPAPVVEEELDPRPIVRFLSERVPYAEGEEADWADIMVELTEWWREEQKGANPPAPKQLGAMLQYIAERARIVVRKRNGRVFFVDRAVMRPKP